MLSKIRDPVHTDSKDPSIVFLALASLVLSPRGNISDAALGMISQGAAVRTKKCSQRAIAFEEHVPISQGDDQGPHAHDDPVVAGSKVFDHASAVNAVNASHHTAPDVLAHRSKSLLSGGNAR